MTPRDAKVFQVLNENHLLLNTLPRQTTATAKIKQITWLIGQTQKLKGTLSHFRLRWARFRQIVLVDSEMRTIHIAQMFLDI